MKVSKVMLSLPRRKDILWLHNYIIDRNFVNKWWYFCAFGINTYNSSYHNSSNSNNRSFNKSICWDNSGDLQHWLTNIATLKSTLKEIKCWRHEIRLLLDEKIFQNTLRWRHRKNFKTKVVWESVELETLSALEIHSFKCITHLTIVLNR